MLDPPEGLVDAQHDLAVLRPGTREELGGVGTGERADESHAPRLAQPLVVVPLSPAP